VSARGRCGALPRHLPPYEYPRSWFAAGTYLAEQYLLQAFLIGNETYEILFAAHAVSRALPERLGRTIRSSTRLPWARGVLDAPPVAVAAMAGRRPATRAAGQGPRSAPKDQQR